jgi:hypothetical protein
VIENIFIRYTQDLVSKFFQAGSSCRIPFRLPGLIVDATIDFDDDSNFMTIKVDNVAINWDLPAKLQAQRSAIFQLNPDFLLRTSFFPPHLARAVQKNFWGI